MFPKIIIKYEYEIDIFVFFYSKSGELITKQGKGTPQGGAISPLLANLFLHYGFDKWLAQTDKTVNFTRYADDVIVHCKSKP